MLVNDASPKLFVKSFFASSMEEAIEQAHAEMGPDALLLNSREAPPEARQLGAYEVVFGSRPASQPLALCPAESVEDLRKRMEELRDMVSRIGATRHPALAGAVSDGLLEAGVDATLAVEIEVAVQQRLRSEGVIPMAPMKRTPDWDPAIVRRHTAAEIETRFEVAPELGRVAALVGPPGCGKTTCLIKLAVTHGLAKRRPVRLISIDNYRIAAAAQLQTYAEVLGTPFTLVETPTALAHAIEAAPPEALVLIDTPGYAASSVEDSAGDVARFLASRQDIDIHLILTASTRLADLRRAVDRYEVFRPAKLFFTRLDETDSSAAMFSEAARTGKPLSFFATGQLVPEDLEPATKERVTRLLVPQLPQACEAVA
jgi:flagellar biosynthesis protein FlhF